jgi:hypothetical protein
MKHTSKRIKFSDKDYQQFVLLASENTTTLKDWMDTALGGFLEVLQVDEEIDLLAPRLADKCRTVWLRDDLIAKVRLFSKQLLITQNSLIYTALKCTLKDFNGPMSV